MQLISTFSKGFRFLLCFTDVLSKYAQIIPLKDKISIASTDTFPKTLKESNRKPRKTCVDKGSKFYNRSMKSQLEKNATETY